MADETYSFKAEQIGETDMAVLLNVDGDEKWFPRSKITDDGEGWWTVPEWLAISEEIV